MACQLDPKRGIEDPWYLDIVCEGNCQLLNSTGRCCNIIVGISSPFCVFFHQLYHFWDVMMSSGSLYLNVALN